MTICALSSAYGQSGVAVLRISGPETKTLIESITKKIDHKLILKLIRIKYQT